MRKSLNVWGLTEQERRHEGEKRRHSLDEDKPKKSR